MMPVSERRHAARHRAWSFVGWAGFLAILLGWPVVPDPLFDVSYSKVLTSREGDLLGASIAADEQWRFPPLSRVPEKYRVAVLRFEDRRFDRHLGVDPLAVLRALWRNFREDRVVSGASTITMQVVRLSRGKERTYREKLIEALLALRLERSLSKDEILALYAAHAPFGGNVVGLEAAAWRYFGRGPGDLSWAEAALLAVLPNNPSLMHPGRNRDGLGRRRDALLRDLSQAGALDALELALALREPLPSAPRALPRLAPHLLESLAANAPSQARFRSTLDRGLQRQVVERVGRHADQLAQLGIGNLAVLVIDNASFEVRAYVGNARTHYALRGGLAVDLVHARRSTGSVLKPFLYSAMLESGEILPKALVPDVPTQYGGFVPENFDRSYRGAVPADVALSRSLNVPAVRMLRRFGVPRFQETLTRLGMTTLHRTPEAYGLTLVLGGAEGSLFELTSLYANLARLANETQIENPNLAMPIVLVQDAVRERPSPLGPGSAWLTLRALAEVSRPESEGDWRAFATSRRISWKTGTSYGLRDAWALGTTPNYTVGVWAGNASGAGVAGLSGASSAGPLLFDVFGALPPAGGFAPPQHDLKIVDTCTSDGYLADELCESQAEYVPRRSQRALRSPHHVRVHLSADERFRVDSRCASVSEMTTRGWFVLPPNQEFFYRAHHPDYQRPPSYHPDCTTPADVTGSAIALLYPSEDTAVYIPVALDGQPSQVVFEAVHRRSDATLHWHLDERYLATTHDFHQIALRTHPGRHRLTLVDQRGEVLTRSFDVLGAQSAKRTMDSRAIR